jgi:hypothetical protein
LSTRKAVISFFLPRGVSSSPVATQTMAKSATSAWLMKCLVPFSTKSPPSCRAKAFIPRRSDPAPGSVIAWQSCRSPADAGQQVAVALLALAGQKDVRRPADGGPVQRVVRLAEFLFVKKPGQRIEARPPDLDRHVGGVKTGRHRLGLDLSRRRSSRRMPVRSTSCSCG